MKVVLARKNMSPLFERHSTLDGLSASSLTLAPAQNWIQKEICKYNLLEIADASQVKLRILYLCLRLHNYLFESGACYSLSPFFQLLQYQPTTAVQFSANLIHFLFKMEKKIRFSFHKPLYLKLYINCLYLCTLDRLTAFQIFATNINSGIHNSLCPIGQQNYILSPLMGSWMTLSGFQGDCIKSYANGLSFNIPFSLLELFLTVTFVESR